MAVTGVLLFGFVLVHMAGNLQVYLGPEAMNAYAAWLRGVLHGAGLWIARAGLLAAAGLHIWAATSLTLESRAARPVGYHAWTPEESTYASRTMRWGGVIIALFVVYHILDLTTGTLNPHGVQGEIYNNVTADFQRWYVVLAYTVAVVTLGFHLRHGVWSALRSLGFTAVSRQIALGYAAMITAGFLAVPYGVLFGFVHS